MFLLGHESQRSGSVASTNTNKFNIDVDCMAERVMCELQKTTSLVYEHIV